MSPALMSPADDIQVEVHEPAVIAASVTLPPAVIVTAAAPEIQVHGVGIGVPGPPGPQGPPGSGSGGTGGIDGSGAANQIGVWEDADTIKGSSALTQDANGITVHRDFIGDHSADYHGLKGGTGRVLFGPLNMFIATQADTASITLNPGNNDYGSSVMISQTGVSFQKPVELPGDPTQPTQAATKRYVDDHAGTPGPAGPQGVAGAQGPQGPPGQWTQLTQAQYDALSPPNPTTLYVIVG